MKSGREDDIMTTRGQATEEVRIMIEVPMALMMVVIPGNATGDMARTDMGDSQQKSL